MKTLKIMTLLLLIGSVSACTNSVENPEPVGVGSGVNDLQHSPCALNTQKTAHLSIG